MLDCVKNQWVQQQIQDVAFERQREVETGERVIVGVNEYRVDEEPEVDIEEVSEEDEARQVDHLESVRDARDGDRVDEALAVVREAARGDDNLLPPIISAVKASASVGEICGVLREEFGEYQPGSAL
jgi:methylmalonyl-CoA mutase N-terminal domain/subunit